MGEDVNPGERIVWLGKGLLVSVLVLWAALSMSRAAMAVLQPDGGIDFHIYWYNAHFLLERQDPYLAFLEERQPPPRTYIDRPGEISRPTLMRGEFPAPSQSASLVLLAVPFAYFSWPVAKAMFYVLDVVLMSLTPWIVFRRLAVDSGRWLHVALAAALLGMSATRYAMALGQTSLIVMALMAGSWALAERSPTLAGLLLGLALSKYSMAAAVVLYMLLDRRLRVLMVAGLMQALAFAGLAAWTGRSLLVLLPEYLAILRLIDVERIQLAALLPDRPGLNLVAAVALTAVLLAILALWRARFSRASMPPAEARLADLFVLAALSLWALLVVYHRAYDVVLAWFGLAAIGYGLALGDPWRIPSALRRLLRIVLFGLGAFFLAPLGGPSGALLPPGLRQVLVNHYSQTVTVVIALHLLLILVLLFRWDRAQQERVPDGLGCAMPG